MSSIPPVLAIADDLTGAAEIAAVGHRLGLRTELVEGWGPPTPTGRERETDLLVVNTETRLSAPEQADPVIRFAADLFKARKAKLVYKKVDSVLRGPVIAELTALADELRRRTVLLVPNNPTLGRVVRAGTYTIDGVPLDKTAFARDPHHPISTANVAALLGEAVRLLPPKEANGTLPPGLVMGEAGDSAELIAWANRTGGEVLAAGGAEFFAAVLRARGYSGDGVPAASGRPPVRPENFRVPRPTLLIRGSTSDGGRAMVERARGRGMPVMPMPGDAAGLRRWRDEVTEALSLSPLVITAVEGPVRQEPGASDRIRENFARFAADLWERRAYRHLLIEGGATAFASLAALGWRRFTVSCEWALGVVSLRPAGEDGLVTIKPGSYRWPETLWESIVAEPIVV